MLAHKITPDLELRLLQLADAKTLFGVVEANRAYLREWLAWVDGTKKLRDAEKFISAGLREYETAQAFSSGIWSAGRLVGVIGHNRIDWRNRSRLLQQPNALLKQKILIQQRSNRAQIDHIARQFIVQREARHDVDLLVAAAVDHH